MSAGGIPDRERPATATVRRIGETASEGAVAILAIVLIGVLSAAFHAGAL